MQIDNGIRSKAFIGTLGNVRQVFFIHESANDAFLAMTIRNFVTHLRHPDRSKTNSNLRKTIAIQGLHDLVHNEGLCVFADDNDGPISTNFAIRIIGRLKDTANENIAVLDTRAFNRKSVVIDFGLVGFTANANARNALRFIHWTFKSFLITANLSNYGLVHLVDR